MALTFQRYREKSFKILDLVYVNLCDAYVRDNKKFDRLIIRQISLIESIIKLSSIKFNINAHICYTCCNYYSAVIHVKIVISCSSNKLELLEMMCGRLETQVVKDV